MLARGAWLIDMLLGPQCVLGNTVIFFTFLNNIVVNGPTQRDNDKCHSHSQFIDKSESLWQ